MSTTACASVCAEQLVLFDNGIDLAALRGVCEVYMVESKSPNTEVAYNHAWKVFAEWCAACGRDPLPASGETVSLHVAWLLDHCRLNVKTIRVKVSALAWRHRSAGFESPVNFSVKSMLRTAARRQRRKSRAKAPVTGEQLASLSRLDLVGGRPRDLRDWAMLLVCFALSWRRSELASLDLSDVEFVGRGVVVRLGRSKGDQEAKGRVVRLPYGASALTCPVRLLREWLRVRGDWAGPLFCSLNSQGGIVGERISGQVVCAGVQRLLARLGVDETRYGAHSLRSGMITAAAEQGANVLHIQQRTGHRTMDTLLGYVRPVEAFRSDPLAGVL
jgi:site-specific recombinase XerD